MVQKNYLTQLREMICSEGQTKFDTIQMTRMLLVYNRRLLEKEEAENFDAQVNMEYMAVLPQCNMHNVKNDGASISSLSTRLVELCLEEVKDLFRQGKTCEEGLYFVHNLVVDMEKTDKKENIRQARELAERSLDNKMLKKDYLAQKTKVEQDNQMTYNEDIFNSLYAKAGSMTKEEFKKRLGMVLLADTNKLISIEDRYLPRVVEEIVKEDIRIQCPANDTRTMSN